MKGAIGDSILRLSIYIRHIWYVINNIYPYMIYSLFYLMYLYLGPLSVASMAGARSTSYLPSTRNVPGMGLRAFKADVAPQCHEWSLCEVAWL